MFDLFTKKSSRVDFKDEILSGLTVAIALVPEAIAFAFVAGVPPLSGLYAAFIVGLITALFGGRPGMISGATGALAVVLVHVVQIGNERGEGLGFEYLLATVVLAGLIQLVLGLLRLGRFIRLVPHPVMMGFVNGLAIVIFLSQISMFRERVGGEVGDWLTGASLGIMLGLVVLTMAIIHFLPKLTRAVPSSLVAILVVTGIVLAGVETQTVSDLASVKGGLPTPHVPQLPLDWTTLAAIAPYALIVALVGLIESLMTLQLIDEITETRGHGNRECVVQGIANITAGFFKGMGGCAMIGQSLINIKSGGRDRLSGVVAALSLLLFIVVGSGVIDQIPIAALVGVMFMVVIGTFEWATFQTFGRVPKSDIIIILVVTSVTVWQDLAIAVLAGVIASALVFAWKSAQHVRLRPEVQDDGSWLCKLQGLLYFGSVREFSERLAPSKAPDLVVVDFLEARVCDYSSIEAINNLAERYASAGKQLKLRHLSPECRKLLRNAAHLVEVDIIEDPIYHVAKI